MTIYTSSRGVQRWWIGGWGGGNGGLTLEAECVGLVPCGELQHLLGVVLELLLQLCAGLDNKTHTRTHAHAHTHTVMFLNTWVSNGFIG